MQWTVSCTYTNYKRIIINYKAMQFIIMCNVIMHVVPDDLLPLIIIIIIIHNTEYIKLLRSLTITSFIWKNKYYRQERSNMRNLRMMTKAQCCIHHHVVPALLKYIIISCNCLRMFFCIQAAWWFFRTIHFHTDSSIVRTCSCLSFRWS